MTIQEFFLILAFFIPLVIIPLFGYKKNPIYFIIGLQLAFYIGHNFYETYLSLNLYDINATKEVKLKAIEAHRDIVFFNSIRSVWITFLYIIFIGILFWNIHKNDEQEKYQTLKVFFRSSLFYFILFTGSVIDILLGIILTNTYWKMSIFSLILALPFFIVAVYLKYTPPKEKSRKTSKLTWIVSILFLLSWFLIVKFL